MVKYYREIEFAPDEVLNDANRYMSVSEYENLLSYYHGNIFSVRQPIQQYLSEASDCTKVGITFEIICYC